jgi:hypothetical protein
MAENPADLFDRVKRGPERTDPIVGEIVRILVQADAATLTRIYALAKAEAAATDAHRAESLKDLFRRSKNDAPADTKPDQPTGGPDQPGPDRQSSCGPTATRRGTRSSAASA